MKPMSQEQKVAAAAGPRNVGAVQTNAPQNSKVAAAAADAGVTVPSPKPAPSGRN